MSKITVTSISGLSDYATTVRAFSTDYTSAVNETSRQFSLKLGEGSDPAKAEAVTAFLDRLNNMQTMVFDNVPAALETYATVVSTYENSLSGAGFQSKVWSDDGGAEAVSSALRGAQIDDIHSVKDSLQRAIDKVAEALESSTFDLSPGVTTAESDLATAATNRTDKDGLLQDAYASFVQGLGDSQAELDGLIAPLQNAQYTIQIPASTVMTAIQKGILTGDEMYYFDAVRTQEDALIIEALLKRTKTSIEEIFIYKKDGQVHQIDPSEVSDGIFAVMTNEMVQWIEDSNVDSIGLLNAFINGMENQSYSVNQIWLNGLQAASTSLAETQVLYMTSTYDKKPESLNSKGMAEDQKYLTSLNKFLGLVESLYVLEIGKTTVSYTPNDKSGYYTSWKNDTTVTVDITSQTISDFGLTAKTTEEKTTLTKHSDNQWYSDVNTITKTTEENYSSQMYSTSEGTSLALNQDRIAELVQQRKEIQENLYKNLAKEIVLGAADKYTFGATSTIVSIINSVSSDSSSDFISSMQKLQPSDVKGTLGVQSYNYATSFLADYLTATEKISRITSSIDFETRDQINKYLNMGGNILKKDSGDAIAFNQYYDFNAALRLRELDNEGIVSFVESAMRGENGMSVKSPISLNGVNSKDYIGTIASETGLSEDVTNYVQGSSDKSLTEFNSDQLLELENFLRDLNVNMPSNDGSAGVEVLDSYLDNKYEYGYK